MGGGVYHFDSWQIHFRHKGARDPVGHMDTNIINVVESES